MASGTKGTGGVRGAIATTRLTVGERKQLRALSVISEKTISDLLRSIIVPVVRQRLREELGQEPAG